MSLNTETIANLSQPAAQAEVIMNLLEQDAILILPGVLALIVTITEAVMKMQMELRKKLIKIVMVLAPALF